MLKNQKPSLTSRRSRRDISHTLVLSHKSFGRNSLLILPSEYHSVDCGRAAGRVAATGRQRGETTAVKATILGFTANDFRLASTRTAAVQKQSVGIYRIIEMLTESGQRHIVRG